MVNLAFIIDDLGFKVNTWIKKFEKNFKNLLESFNNRHLFDKILFI